MSDNLETPPEKIYLDNELNTELELLVCTTEKDCNCGIEYIRADVAKEREKKLATLAYENGFKDCYDTGETDQIDNPVWLRHLYKQAGLEELK
jgi:hypothetical protein